MENPSIIQGKRYETLEEEFFTVWNICAHLTDEQIYDQRDPFSYHLKQHLENLKKYLSLTPVAQIKTKSPAIGPSKNVTSAKRELKIVQALIKKFGENLTVNQVRNYRKQLSNYVWERFEMNLGPCGCP